MAALADQVNENKDLDWCYPSLQTIQDRTELGERTVQRALASLQAEGLLTIKPRVGYGNSYQFDIPKLEAIQRKKAEGCLQGTRVFTAPVPSRRMRGALKADEGCLGGALYKEEPAVKPAVAIAIERVLDFGLGYSQERSLKPKLVTAKTPPEKFSMAAADTIRLAYPKREDAEGTVKAIRAQHALLVKGLVKDPSAVGKRLPAMTVGDATAYLLTQTQRYAASRVGEDVKFTPAPKKWFKEQRYAAAFVVPGKVQASEPVMSTVERARLQRQQRATA